MTASLLMDVLIYWRLVEIFSRSSGIKEGTKQELFGEEIVRQKDVKKIEQFKSLSEEIKELLESLSAWEINGIG